jgi:hypothetical protein
MGGLTKGAGFATKTSGNAAKVTAVNELVLLHVRRVLRGHETRAYYTRCCKFRHPSVRESSNKKAWSSGSVLVYRDSRLSCCWLWQLQTKSVQRPTGTGTAMGSQCEPQKKPPIAYATIRT